MVQEALLSFLQDVFVRGTYHRQMVWENAEWFESLTRKSNIGGKSIAIVTIILQAIVVIPWTHNEGK